MDVILNRPIFRRLAQDHSGWATIQENLANYIRGKLRSLPLLVANDIMRFQLPWAALDENTKNETSRRALTFDPVMCKLDVLAKYNSGTMLVDIQTLGNTPWANWGKDKDGKPMESLREGATLILEFRDADERPCSILGVVTERDSHMPKGRNSIREVMKIHKMKMVVLIDGCPSGLPGTPGAQGIGHGNRSKDEAGSTPSLQQACLTRRIGLQTAKALMPN
jgi:hypothetical protein